MKYFKLIRGYGAEDYMEIDETELKKAQYCFLEKKDSIFSGGAIRGSQILAIQPDYHKTMGWNRGYKLQAEDYQELSEKNLDREYRDFLNESRLEVLDMMKTGKIYQLET